MGHDVHSLPGRDGGGAHFFTYGAGRPGSRGDKLVIGDAELAGDPRVGLNRFYEYGIVRKERPQFFASAIDSSLSSNHNPSMRLNRQSLSQRGQNGRRLRATRECVHAPVLAEGFAECPFPKPRARWVRIPSPALFSMFCMTWPSWRPAVSATISL